MLSAEPSLVLPFSNTMTEPYLICIDIDGTLTVTPDGRVPQENRDALLRARADGHVVMVNTGRAYANLPPLLLAADCCDGWICANGSYLRIGDKVLRNQTIPRPVARDLIAYCIEKNDRFCLFEGETTVLKVREFSALYGFPGTRIDHADELDTRFAGAEFNVMSCEGTLPPEFHARFGQALNIFQCDTFADCTVHGCSKAIGLRLAADHFGIPIERTIAIGDSANDLPMLQAAGTSVAMGNAPAHIRDAADYVTGDNTDCGVAQALQKLIFSKGECL